MPSLNQGLYLPLAVQSVFSQQYPNLELVVADGGSSDGSVAWLSDHAQKDKRLRFISQKDSGPAQALNRALALARGTVIGWLNSDDLYTHGSLVRAVDALLSSDQLLMVYGHGMHVDKRGDVIDRYPTLKPDTPISRFTEGCFICQPTVFFKRSMNILLGPLDETLKTAFDFDYWLRAFKKFPDRIGFIDATQAHSRFYEDTITSRMREQVTVESMRVLHKHLGYTTPNWFLGFIDESQAKQSNMSITEKLAYLFDTFEIIKPLLSDADAMRITNRLQALKNV